MRVSLKTWQVAGVTMMVGLVVLVLSAVHLASLARVSLQESHARCDFAGPCDLSARARGRSWRPGPVPNAS